MTLSISIKIPIHDRGYPHAERGTNGQKGQDGEGVNGRETAFVMDGLDRQIQSL